MSTQALPEPILTSTAGTVTATTGQIQIGQTVYAFPTNDGQPGQVLVTSGTGQLTWQVPSAASGSFASPVLFQNSINFQPTDVYANYTVAEADNFIRYRGSNPATITLPSAVGSVRQLLIKNRSNAALTVIAVNADTIDGDTGTITLDVQFLSASMMSDGLGNWLLI